MGTLRVLHVCAPGSPGGGSCLLRLLAATRRAAPQDGVLLLGPAGASREAALVGLGPHWRLPPLLGAPALLRVPLRRAIAAWRPLLLHAWDAESALLLARIAPDLEGAPPMAATLTAVREPAGAAPLSLDRMEALRFSCLAFFCASRISRCSLATSPSNGLILNALAIWASASSKRPWLWKPRALERNRSTSSSSRSSFDSVSMRSRIC